MGFRMVLLMKLLGCAGCLSGREVFSGAWLCGLEQLPTPKGWGLLRILLTSEESALGSQQPLVFAVAGMVANLA